MGWTGIISLAAGCLIFIVSFVLPERKRRLSRDDIRLGEAQVKKLVQQEMQNAENKISELVEETIAQKLEKTERSLDRLSNEKIMAVNEYSDTVLEAIHTNHKEVMFLYDMLNNKEEALKEAIREVAKAERKVKEAAIQGIPAKEPLMLEEPVQEEIMPEEAEQENLMPEEWTPEIFMQSEAEPVIKHAKTVQEGSARNSNDQVLALHKQGWSNLEIAKQLGLGIGEVKLVIDLYEGL